MFFGFYLVLAMTIVEIVTWKWHNDSIRHRIEPSIRVQILCAHTWSWSVIGGVSIIYCSWQVGYMPDTAPVPLAPVLFTLVNASIAFPLTVHHLNRGAI